eukprot:scaffold91255_cov63-Phaeocystis_antarctica.AAC.1
MPAGATRRATQRHVDAVLAGRRAEVGGGGGAVGAVGPLADGDGPLGRLRAVVDEAGRKAEKACGGSAVTLPWRSRGWMTKSASCSTRASETPAPATVQAAASVARGTTSTRLDSMCTRPLRTVAVAASRTTRAAAALRACDCRRSSPPAACSGLPFPAWSSARCVPSGGASPPSPSSPSAAAAAAGDGGCLSCSKTSYAAATVRVMVAVYDPSPWSITSPRSSCACPGTATAPALGRSSSSRQSPPSMRLLKKRSRASMCTRTGCPARSTAAESTRTAHARALVAAGRTSTAKGEPPIGCQLGWLGLLGCWPPPPRFGFGFGAGLAARPASRMSAW